MHARPTALLTLVLAGCGGQTEPTSTDMTSDALPTLAERVEFLQRYVTFRRGYSELGFRIHYRNNGGGLIPGPSEWDIRLVAKVPSSELGGWVPADVEPASATDAGWLADVPDGARAAGISEWYTGPGMVVGVDRSRSIVAYRRWKP